MNDPAILALTPRGLELGRRLAEKLGRGEVVAPAAGPGQVLRELFQEGRPLVCIMALGIVVRLLGTLVRDKETDPPVVVVDEAGRFAIGVLGGHVAGANQLAIQVAEAIGAMPVITTASEVLGLPAVDLIGRDRGWKIERPEDLTRLAAAVVRGEAIGVYQDHGRRDWWQVFGDWPASFHEIKEWPPEERWGGLIAITDRALSIDSSGKGFPSCPVVIYRPSSLVLGVGCRRGVPCEEIEELFQHVCHAGGWSPLSLGLVATASIKADEPGLQQFAELHGLALVSFSPDELNAVGPLPTPSETVRAKIGIAGVAEPAAMLAARTTSLVMPKYRGQRVTLALARRSDP